MAKIHSTKTSNSVFPNGTTEMPAGIGAAIKVTKPLVAKFAAMHGKTLENATALSQHWSDFVNVLTEENLKLSKQLTECTTPLDLHLAFAKYWKTAASHYHAGFTQMAAQAGAHHRRDCQTCEQALSRKKPRHAGAQRGRKVVAEVSSMRRGKLTSVRNECNRYRRGIERCIELGV